VKIIILGAGQVGTAVARNLADEGNDVTVIDTNATVLAEMQSRLDLRAVVGVASHPAVLREAGADDADMLIATTSSDEVNMLACQVAYTIFGIHTKIARVRSNAYQEVAELFEDEHIPVDYLISPEQLVTRHMHRLIELPGALQVVDFADGRLRLIGVTAEAKGALVGHSLRTLRDHLPDVDCRVAAIYRDEHAIIPNGDTRIEDGDDVFFLATRHDAIVVMREMRAARNLNKHIMIAGGGNIGFDLARQLEMQKYNVKLIERNHERCIDLATQLKHTTVLEGDAADHELLNEENIGEMDVFCALTNDDEANILSAIMAKRLGAATVMSLVNRTAYADLIPTNMIDIAISPHQVTIGELLTHIRRGSVAAVHSLRRGGAEVIEAVAKGGKEESKLVGRRIEEIKLPHHTNVGAVVRGNLVLMGHRDVVIEEEDHLIFFLTDKKRIPEVEQLCSVSATTFL